MKLNVCFSEPQFTVETNSKRHGQRARAQPRPGGHRRDAGGLGSASGNNPLGSASDQRFGGDGRIESCAAAVQPPRQQAGPRSALHHLRHSHDSSNVGGNFITNRKSEFYYTK